MRLRFRSTGCKVSAAYGLLVHQTGDLDKPGWQYLVEALQEAQTRGLVSRIGVSVYDEAQLKLVESRFRPELVQLPLNALDRRLIASGALARLKARGVEVHARSVFLQGLLLTPPSELPDFFRPLRQRLADLRGGWARRGLSPLAACLAFVLRTDGSRCGDRWREQPRRVRRDRGRRRRGR